MSRLRRAAAARPRRPTIELSIDLDGAATTSIAHRPAVLRPHARPARPPRRLRPDQSAGGGRPARRQPPHGRGRRHRARRGVPRRRSATRPASAGSPAACSPWTRPWSRWRSTCPAAPSSCGRSSCPSACRSASPPFDPQLAEHAIHSFATAAGITLHVTLRRGRNVHHIIEATFKGLARCLRDAVRVEGDRRARRPRACCERADGRRLAARSPSLDYGIGNLRSAEKALDHVGADARLTADRRPDPRTPPPWCCPGVGAFGRCLEALRRAGLEDVALDAVASGRPFLGICIGMQMLFERVRRGSGVARPRRHPGAGRLDPGRGEAPADAVEPASTSAARSIRCSLALGDSPWVYFVHSLHGVPADAGRRVVATCEYGTTLNAAFRRDNVVRHPVPPGEVRRRRAALARQRSPRLAATASRRADGPLPGHRPARVDGPSGCTRATTRRRPSTATTRWAAPSRSPPAGARWIHVVDLDAARTGEPLNRSVGGRPSPRPSPAGRDVQTGGGVRTVADGAGARRGRRRPGRDGVGGRPLARRGRAGRRRRLPWPSASTTAAASWPSTAGPRAAACACSTCSTRFPAASRVRRHRHQPRRHAGRPGPRRPGRGGRGDSSVPVIASGGVGTLDDLVALRAVAGLAGVIVGKALYEQRFDAG